MNLPHIEHERYHFINNAFGSFFRGVLDWFGDEFYPKFEYRVIGTYDKAVEFFNKKRELGQEVNSNILPSITLDPQLDFSPEERGGRFPRQTYYLDPMLNRRLFNGINLYDQDSLMTPVFSRYEGTFELIFWLRSIYELLDIRTYLFQYTGGFGRYIRPRNFNSFIIIPDEFREHEWLPGKKLDWNATDGYFLLIENMNKIQYVIPVLLTPMCKLESLNDNSTKYGGDQLAEFKLSATFKYEIELPTYMILSNRVGNCKVNYNFSLSKIYTRYDWQAPYSILKEMSTKDFKLSADLSSSREFEIENKNIQPLIELQNSIVNPLPEDLINWNPIVSGTLVEIKDTETQITKDDIAYFDNFNDYHMHQLRICKGAISKRGSYNSTLLTKSKILNKPIICHSSLYEHIEPYFGSTITVDPTEFKIYLGEIKTREVLRTDIHFGEKTLRILKMKNTKDYNEAIDKVSLLTPLKETIYKNTSNQKLLIGKGNGERTTFETNISLQGEYSIYCDNEIVTNYTVDNTRIIFENPPKNDTYIFYHGPNFHSLLTKMIAVYEFTKEDETKDCVKIDFPIQVKSDNVIINTYIGVLKEGIHWKLNESDKSITLFNVKAKENEIVEIFGLYRND